MYPSVEDATQRHRDRLVRAQQQGRLARLRAMRRATRRAARATERLDRALVETMQLRSELDAMS
jgi:hypothetical protein